ncbi:MAG: hypothetical protein ACT4OL_08950, partial [Nitrospiraceae bacterium]
LAANTLVIIILVWNGFIRGFVIFSYVPKLVDGAMPFALGAAQYTPASAGMMPLLPLPMICSPA